MLNGFDPSHNLLILYDFGVFPQTVHCWGTQFYLKVCPPCVRGCVRLRTICLPIHLSPNSFVSQVLCQGLRPPPGDLSPNSFVSQFICLPGPVSGAVSASGICLPIHLSALCQGLCPPPDDLSPNSFVSQVLWQGLCPPPGDWFPNSFVSQFICLPSPVSGAVSAFGGFVSQFVCLPSFPTQLTVGVFNSILRCVRLVSGAVSASLGSVSPISPQTVYCWRSQFSFKRCPAMFRWWCLALRMSRIHLSPCGNSFVSQSGWWCPALWLSPIPLFALISTHLFPSLAGGVPLSGCLQFICLPLSQLICFPVWLVVSGSSAVSNSFVSPCGNSFVSQSGWWCPALLLSQSRWWCPALWLSLIHLSPFFPKQFTVGVLNSILKCVRLVSGAVSASGRFVFQFICLPIHLSPRSCVRGCVRLRGICLPIHLSPNSFVSQVLCQGLCPPRGFVSQFICPPCVRACVRLRTICLPIHLSPRSLSPNSFVSQVLWQGLCPPPGDWFPNSFVSQFICLPSPVSGAVSAFGGFVSQFVCLPSFPTQLTVGVFNSILRCVRLVSGAVSASLGSVSPISPQTVYCWRSQFSFKRCPAMFRWWCLALRMSRIHLSPCGNSFVSQSGWWCPALWLSPIPLFALISNHLFPSLAGGVPLSGCLQFICLPLSQLICFPVWLVVSGSSAVSNSFVSPCGNSFVSQSGWWCPALLLSQSRWWCPALWLSLIHLSPFFPKQFTVGVLNSILKCVRLVSGAVSASGRFVFQFICLPIHLSPRSCVRGCVRLRGICLPIHLSPNSFVSQVLCQGLCPPPGDLSPNSFVSQVLCQGLCPRPDDLSPNSFVSQFICLPGPCLPIHLSPRSCGRGCVRLRGIGFPIHLSPNSFVSQVLCQGLCPPSGDLFPNSFVFHHSPNSLLLGYSILS